MRLRYLVRVVSAALIGLFPLVGDGQEQNASEDACAQTAHLQIYSNAVFVEEAGDVVGYEIAFQQRKRNSIDALLYFYEGVPNEDGVHISGQISGVNLTMRGNWVQHLIEEPSKKEIVETHPVEVAGTLNPNRFRGTIKVSDLATPVTLKHINHIWVCRR